MKTLILLTHLIVGRADRRKVCSIAFLIDAKEAFISANPTLIHNCYKALMDEGLIGDLSEYERTLTDLGHDQVDIPPDWPKIKKMILELSKYSSKALFTAATTYYNLRVLQGREISFIDAIIIAEKVAEVHHWDPRVYSDASVILLGLGLIDDT